MFSLPQVSGLGSTATTSAVDIVAVVTFVAMWVQLTKPFIEYWWFTKPVATASPIHDAVIRFYTFMTAFVTIFGLLLIPPALTEVFYSVVAVLSATGLYHSLNGGQPQSAVIDPVLLQQIETALEAKMRALGLDPPPSS